MGQKVQKMRWYKSPLKSDSILGVHHCNKPSFHNTYVSRKKKHVCMCVYVYSIAHVRFSVHRKRGQKMHTSIMVCDESQNASR